jgi:lipoprotein NlpI
LVLYNTVLSEDSTDPDALANAGWLQWKSGFAAHSAKVVRTGRQEVEEAVRVAPDNYEAHLYLGVILINQDGDAAGAQKQFAAFLSEDPPTVIVHQEASLIAGVYVKLGLPVPAQLNAATTGTSTP